MKRIIATALAALVLFASPAMSFNWSGVAQRLEASTVMLATFEGDGYCSGWVIDNKNDYVMTAEHCLGEDQAFIDRLATEVQWRDSILDAAVLQVPGINRPALKVAKTPAKPGQEIASYGFAREWGLYRHFRAGHVSAINASVDGLPGPWVVSDQAFIGGMSGGPVVNTDGQVVSMVQRSDRKLVGIGRAIKEIHLATKKFWRG